MSNHSKTSVDSKTAEGELHGDKTGQDQLRDNQLDAVSGGKTSENNTEQLRAAETFKNFLQKAGQI